MYRPYCCKRQYFELGYYYFEKILQNGVESNMKMYLMIMRALMHHLLFRVGVKKGHENYHLTQLHLMNCVKLL